MEHSELVQDMMLLEKLTAQERLKHARRRRQQQLENWARRNVASDNNVTISTTMTNGIHTTTKSTRSKKYSVQFPENIVLLEGK
jgi:protein phosphatase 1 regulatory subunit 16A